MVDGCKPALSACFVREAAERAHDHVRDLAEVMSPVCFSICSSSLTRSGWVAVSRGL